MPTQEGGHAQGFAPHGKPRTHRQGRIATRPLTFQHETTRMPTRPTRCLPLCIASLLLLASASAYARQPSPAASGSRLATAEVQTLLREHNRARANVGVAPLHWSAPVAQSAQRWADHLAASSCRMQHSRGSGYGENLFIGTAGHYGVKDAALAWEREKKRYDGGALRAGNSQGIGHYTQMVWHNTRRLGCARSQCGGRVIVVCNYEPAGNYFGQAPY